MNKPLHGHLTYIEMHSPNPEHLREFYGNKLGYTTRPEKNATNYVQVFLGNNLLVGFAKGEAPVINRIFIHVPDVENARTHLLEIGLSPSVISNAEWGQPATTLKDPDGRTLAFTKQGD